MASKTKAELIEDNRKLRAELATARAATLDGGDLLVAQIAAELKVTPGQALGAVKALTRDPLTAHRVRAVLGRLRPF